MTSERPTRVSVLMPAYNASATVAAAAASVLAQTVSDLELLVVDDGSDEPIADALQDFTDERLRVIRRSTNGGVSAARNSGLAAARAPLIAQLDADDRWRADHLEDLVPLFADQRVGLAYSNVEVVGYGGSDRWIAERSPGDGLAGWISDRSMHPINDLRTLYQANAIPSPGVVMRTAAVRAVGGYPEWLRVGEEYLVYIRLMRAGWRFAYVDERSATYFWPDPGRGATLNERRNSREEAKLFAVLALTSRPDRDVFTRLAFELRDIIKTHVPIAVSIWGRIRRARRAL
jgi:glycosyltransferase involved in cell wall biosynthesis